MGKVNIEYINVAQDNTNVSTRSPDFTIDLRPIDFTNVSFEIVNTLSTSTDSGAIPAAATHAVVTSVDGSHYIRQGTAPTTTTGGMCAMVGSSRVIDVSNKLVLKICTTA